MNTIATIAAFALAFIIALLVIGALAARWKARRVETPELDKIIFRRNRRGH